jgi:hypothetical protein
MVDRIRRELFDTLGALLIIVCVIIGVIVVLILLPLIMIVGVLLAILIRNIDKNTQDAAVARSEKERSWLDQEPEATFLTYRTGFRTWEIQRDGDKFVLASAWNLENPWPAREKLTARCMINSMNHEAPFPTCGCGIYASYTMEYITNVKKNVTRMAFLGEVKLWGLTLEYSDGARARFAYPLNITHAGCSTCDNYVDLEKASYYYLGDNVIAFCAKHNREVVCNSDHGFQKADPSFLSQIAEDYGITIKVE